MKFLYNDFLNLICIVTSSEMFLYGFYLPGRCDIPPTNDLRLGCGHVNQQDDRQAACENRGCCWNDTVRGVNWCFFPGN